jgi:hypothetical protein
MAGAPLYAVAETQPAGPELSDGELDSRLAFIETRLERRQPAAKTWQYGWTGFYALSSAGQLYAALDSNDNDDQLTYTVGAVKAAGGLAQVLLNPLSAAGSGERFRALPAASREERLRKLADGEAMLEANARRAAERYTWKRHAMGIVGNLLGGVVIAAFGEQDDAVTSTLVGLAVSELTIWTEPAAAAEDLEDYRNGRWSAQAARPGEWRVVATPGGAALHIAF